MKRFSFQENTLCTATNKAGKKDLSGNKLIEKSLQENYLRMVIN